MRRKDPQKFIPFVSEKNRKLSFKLCPAREPQILSFIQLSFLITFPVNRTYFSSLSTTFHMQSNRISDYEISSSCTSLERFREYIYSDKIWFKYGPDWLEPIIRLGLSLTHLKIISLIIPKNILIFATKIYNLN